ncbi:hypothetical protein [Spiroplasma endosymbiont of Seladonia tumulorum]|uniref:hypothetical protein n=1 Tax=Spiroplasma endosymbiont of Seladonia tumulorum TaxID=3066321 RepID=UPI0030CD2008
MLKPSEKMLSQLAENDEPIDYSIDSIPLDFANQLQYSDPDLEQLFTEARARTLYIYKINNLVKTKQKPTLNYSQNSVKITDFKWKNQNSIHLVLQKSLPEDTLFTGIEIKYPKSMLFGNIKCWGNVNGVYSYPQSIIQNANLVPLLSMPIETEPNLRIFQYWFTESFLPWSIAKNYIQGEDILDLIDKDSLKLVLLNYLTYRYNYDRKFQEAKYDEKGNPTNKTAELRQKFEGQKPEDVIDGLIENWKLDNPTLISDKIVKIFKQIIYMLSNYAYSKYTINKGYNDDVKLIAPYYFKLISKPTEIGEVGYWEFKNCVVELNSSYFNFTNSGPVPPEPINYWKEVYANEKPFNEIENKWYFVIWHGLFNNEWKISMFNNNAIQIRIDTTSDWLMKNFGDLQVGYGKSWKDWTNYPNYFKSVYLWNKNNYPNTPIIDPKTGQITDWNLKQQSIGEKNKDNNNNVTVKNKDISKNPIYQLEANYFNWLSLTNELETNNIPSLIPAEIKLSDGEYGKYLTNLIVSNNKIEDYLNYFSQWYILLYSKAVWMSMTKNLVEYNIKITFDEKLFNLNQIEISGIWGYGNYDITIHTEKEQININNLELFNKNNEKLSLITLEI